jgi:D-amino-acid dehydrogenase
VPDVAVVGGGAVGVSAALELARRGARVILLERGGELAWGCSAGNAGLLCPSHFVPLASPAALRDGLRWLLKPDSPFYLRPRPAVAPWLVRFTLAARAGRAEESGRVLQALAQASLELHVALADEGLDTGLRRDGVLNVYFAENGLAAAQRDAEHNARAGLDSQLLSPAEARARAPALGPGVVGAIFYPGDAHCDPLRFVQEIGRAAAGAGAELRTRVEALRFRRRNGRVHAVETTSGTIPVGEVVLAAGAWTPALADGLGVFLPVEGGKGYHVDLEAASEDPGLPVWLNETRVIVTPLEGRLRLAGTLELAGLDLRVDERRVAAIVRAAERALPSLRGRTVLEVWRGLRPCTPDGLPVIGRPPRLENVVLASGHGMMGLTLAPVTAKLVGEIVARDQPSVDLAPLSPARFRPLVRRARPS